MPSKDNKKPPLVSSLSMTFKRVSTSENQDNEEAKKEHRKNLKVLMDDFMDRVAKGEVEGIRNAKDLVEVIKMDLVLMGEASDRTETNTVDDDNVAKITKTIDPDDPRVASLMEDLLMKMNDSNDERDTNG